MINAGSDQGSFDVKFRLGDSVLEVSAKELDKLTQKGISWGKTWSQVKLFVLTGNVFGEKFVRSIIGKLKLDTLQKIDQLQLKSLGSLVKEEITVRRDKLIPLIEELIYKAINEETGRSYGIQTEDFTLPAALKQKMDEWNKIQEQVTSRTEWLFSEISREIEDSAKPEQVYKKYFGEGVEIPAKELASVASYKSGQISLRTRKISLLSVKQFRDHVKQKHDERLQSLYDKKLRKPIHTELETYKNRIQNVNIKTKDDYQGVIDEMKNKINTLFSGNPELKEIQEDIVRQCEKGIIEFRIDVDRKELERRMDEAVHDKKDMNEFASEIKKIETDFHSKARWGIGHQVLFAKNSTSYIAKLEKEKAQKLVADMSKTLVTKIQEGKIKTKSFLDIAKEIEQEYSLEGDSDFAKMYNVQLSMARAQKAVESGYPPPSIKDMVADFSERDWKTDEEGKSRYTGYVCKKEQHRDDQKNLEFILAAHNQQYKDKVALTEDNEVGGIFEKIEVGENVEIMARADLHSDLRSLLAQLELFKEKGKLDDDYRCKDGFQMIFLGDYMDRGINDMEVMSLILNLRIKNPGKVHLIRGNHEDIQQKGSEEREWLSNREQEFTKCFKTFPLALFVGGPKKKGRREYAHFSHGALSTLVDPRRFLEGTESTMVLKNDVGVSKALKRISGQKVRWWSKFTGKQKKEALRKEKKIEAAKELSAAQEMEMQVLAEAKKGMLPGTKDSDLNMKLKGAFSYMWADIEGKKKEVVQTDELIPSSVEEQKTPGIQQVPGRWISIAPRVMRAYSRMSGSKAKVKTFIRGHQHTFNEFTVKTKTGEKVIATTLAVGIAGNAYREHMEEEKIQGIVYKVAPRMKEWQKTEVIAQGKEKELQLRLGEKSVSMYEKMPRQK